MAGLDSSPGVSGLDSPCLWGEAISQLSRDCPSGLGEGDVGAVCLMAA